MDKELYEILADGEALYLLGGEPPSAEAATNNNALYHLASYEWARAVIRSLGPTNLRVLDVACGSGYGTARLAQLACVRSVIGVDISERQLQYARQRHPGPRVSFLHGDATNLQEVVPAKSVEVVVSFQTFEHLLDPAAFLTGVHASLTKQGAFLLATPTHEQTVCLVPGNPYHVAEHSEESIQRLLSFFFERVRLFDEVPCKGVFDIIRERTRGHADIPRGNFALATRPRRRLKTEDILRFRGDALLSIWGEDIKRRQRAAIESRRQRHFLTTCYQFLELEAGFHPPEVPHVWTMAEARFAFVAPSPGATASFTMAPAPLDISADHPVTVDITLPDGAVTRRVFTDRRPQTVSFPCQEGRNPIQLTTDRTWVPAEHSDSSDIRSLGLRLSEFRITDGNSCSSDLHLDGDSIVQQTP